MHIKLGNVSRLKLKLHEAEAYGVLCDASLKRRARLLISNSAIPRQTRALIRYALEKKDPYLAQVVRRVEGGEVCIERLYLENGE